MSNLEEKLHRTWIQYLIDIDSRGIASFIVDAKLVLSTEENYDGIIIHQDLQLDLPLHCYIKINCDNNIIRILERSFKFIAKGHLRRWDDTLEEFPIHLRVKLIDIEENWQKAIKYLIANSKDLNQALITEKVFARNDKKPFIYNEIKFASKSEIRIAQELESIGVLFFPLPLAVRYETERIYEDHREVDFLVCLDGTWGILEVSYHPDRFEQDKEKDAWFKKSGILCVEHYSAERCYNQPKAVIGEFLSILSKHKR